MSEQRGTDRHPGEGGRHERRRQPAGYVSSRPLTTDSQRNRMAPPPYDPVAFRATVEATQDAMERRLTPSELGELRHHRATPPELLTRDTVRQGLGRNNLSPAELAAIRAGVDPLDIIRGSTAATTTVIPQNTGADITSYLPKMTRLDNATENLTKIK